MTETQKTVLAIIVGAVVGIASTTAGAAFAATSSDHEWPQVCRVVHPEDLDR